MIKVLVVDDSVLFRSQIQLALHVPGEIDVVGTAANGKIALEKLAGPEIDLVTMDLEMPVMDGLTAIKEIRMKNKKMKIIVFSSASALGAQKTMEAMAAGATDFVCKPMADGSGMTPADKIKHVLLPKVLSLFPKREPLEKSPYKAPSMATSWELLNPRALVVASSTGGPPALLEFFKHLRGELPFPVLVTQHMPPIFTASLAKSIGDVAGRECREAIDGEVVKANTIYIAPGDFHMSVAGTPERTTIVLDQRELRNYVRPCADFLFETAGDVYKKHVVGIVFTGMGRDGADGARKLKALGATVLIQNRETSVVFGMPGAVHEARDYDFEGSPQALAEKITTIIQAKRAAYVA